MRLRAKCRRLIAWRHWPWALFLLPVFIYVVSALVRDKFRLNILAANPGLRRDGRVSGSKHLVYDRLHRHTQSLPHYRLVPSVLSTEQRMEAFAAFLQDRSGGFPVVLKPDNSERGHAVAVISNMGQAAHYLTHAPYDVVVQEFVEGEDFGLLVQRSPDLSGEMELQLCRRAAISVTGTGTETLCDLIVGDRVLCVLYDLIANDMQDSMCDVPAKGEVVRLTRSFAISRDLKNVAFEDLSEAITGALSGEIRKICAHLGGYCAGRFDLRAKSLEHLQRGDFQLLEVNNVLSEPIYVFDPRYSLLDAYRGYFKYCAQAIEAGRHNVRIGLCPAPTLRHGWDILVNIRQRRKAEVNFERELDAISQIETSGQPGRVRPESTPASRPGWRTGL